MDEPEASTQRRSKSNRNPKSYADIDGPAMGQDDSEDDDFQDAEAARPPQTKRRRAKDVAVTDDGYDLVDQPPAQSLIEVIKGNGRHIKQVVKLWVEHYEKNPKAALVELLLMLFEACGAKYYLMEDVIDETDVDDVAVDLVSLAKRGLVEDFQTSKRKEFKNFKENLFAFWDNLILECQNGPLFDQVLFDKCMDYIIALSCSSPF